MTKILMLVLGYSFLVLGVAGLFLPILQGILFICVGLIILSRHAAWAERALGHLKSRHPKVEAAIEKAEELAAIWGSRVAALFIKS